MIHHGERAQLGLDDAVAGHVDADLEVAPGRDVERGCIVSLRPCRF
jgi:hypothetical protein